MAHAPVRLQDSELSPRPKVVALAEDDPAFRSLLAEALERDGHRVIQVGTGNALINLVQRILLRGEDGGRIDLMISDVRMPAISGLVAIQLLRQADFNFPIILITAFSDQWTRARAAEHGAVLFDKPLELRAFREHVREMLRTEEEKSGAVQLRETPVARSSPGKTAH